MDIVSLAPILLLVVAFYFLLIRPQRNRAKAQQAMIAAVRPGARVMTTAGIFGTVVAVSEEVMSIEIAPGIAMEVLPAAIAPGDAYARHLHAQVAAEAVIDALANPS